MLSTHKVEVVVVTLESHSNADSLSIVRPFGYSVCVRTEDWQNGQLGAYLPPDSLVNTERPEFVFLHKDKKWERIKAKKLRGVQSFGLLVHAPEGSIIGDDVASVLEVQHYEPPEPMSTGGEVEKVPPHLYVSKYDVDSMRRYPTIFYPGEMVMITEKIHGASSRFCWIDDRIYCGSRSEWKRESDDNLWWKTIKKEPSIVAFCKSNPGFILYGEVYGIQDLRYGLQPNTLAFAAFDIRRNDHSFVNAEESRQLCEKFNVPCVPLISICEFNLEKIYQLAEGQSLVSNANHVREGCVVKPLQERYNDEIGRVQLKIVGLGYLEK